MFILLSFIGKLPNYILDCVHQIRIYYNDDIYLIIDDYDSPYNQILINKYNVKIVKYEFVNDDTRCLKAFYDNKHNISEHIINMTGLVGREKLFIRCIERFFLANTLLNKLNLEDCLFMEIDNLIYNDPYKWLDLFNKKDFSIMAHCSAQCSTGICFIKNKNALSKLLDYMVSMIYEIKLNEWPSEMTFIYKYNITYPDNINFLPIIFNDEAITDLNANKNYDGNYIFDSAHYGQYLLGLDPYHTNGIIVKGKSFDHCIVNCSKYEIKFDYIDGLKKPFIYDTNLNKWILINNLHVHAKNLEEGLSFPREYSKDMIMTGERFQKLAKIYFGYDYDTFNYNPNIPINEKMIYFHNIENEYDNPDIVYCVSNQVKNLINKLDNFKNDFILISCNSDANIIMDDELSLLVNHPKIKKWYVQNLAFEHPKVYIIPIGLANTQWAHGNIDNLLNVMNNFNYEKPNDIYFNFTINTNFKTRYPCYETFKNHIPFLNTIDPCDNLKRLATYKFCLCPEGNGFDTHRLWECYYLNVVPIVLKTDFIDIVKKQTNIPMIILDKWSDLFNIKLKYTDYHFKPYIHPLFLIS